MDCVDPAIALLDRLEQSRHTIAGLLLFADDPFWPHATGRGFPVITLLPEMGLPYRRLSALVEKEPEFQARFAQWLATVSACASDVGLVYYGQWVPPALFQLPPHGFLNFHPSPLPKWRGMEPDTMAILSGCTFTRGTVHRVTEKYDRGAILARTVRVPVSRYATPPDIFIRTTRHAAAAYLRALDALTRSGKTLSPDNDRGQVDASRARIRPEAIIDWEKDTLEQADRRRRAFLGQDDGIRLKARMGTDWCLIDDMEIYAGDFPGQPGDVLGTYMGNGPFCGAAIVKMQGGVAVVKKGPRLTEPWPDRDPSGHTILLPGRRAKRSSRAMILRSIS